MHGLPFPSRQNLRGVNVKNNHPSNRSGDFEISSDFPEHFHEVSVSFPAPHCFTEIAGWKNEQRIERFNS